MRECLKNKSFANEHAKLYRGSYKWYTYYEVIYMIKRERYLDYLIRSKDMDLIKVVTGIRRSGKSMLLLMYKQYLLENGISENNIIHMNFESSMYDDIKDYKDLYNYIKTKIVSGKNYILLDEVQMVNSWEKCVNSLRVDFDVDIYITGSNAYLLSGELATLLSGRYIEIKIYPLSFKEFIEFSQDKYSSKEEMFEKYLKYGGLPSISFMKDDVYIINVFLTDIYNSIVKKDIVDRNIIKDVNLLEKIIKFLSSNIGSIISPNKISDYLNSNKIVEKSNHQTIDNYLKMFENSYIINRVDRYDIKSKEVLKTLGKYYITDIGIRNNLLGFKNIYEGHILENIIYLELVRRGYKVNIGKMGEYEVDFIAEDANEIRYIQVAQSIKEESVLDRELRSLESINDNYEKIILTMDRSLNHNIRGIKIVNIIDFLLK